MEGVGQQPRENRKDNNGIHTLRLIERIDYILWNAVKKAIVHERANLKEAAFMKNVELKLISELMKNSRRSDRELAKAIGVSQPTVSRIIKRLEQEGIIREYAMIPDFNKLGYHIGAITFANFSTPQDLQTMRKLIEDYGKRLSEIPQAILIERGIGEGANGVVISLHESYSDYMEFQRWLKQFGSLSKYELHHFIIDLNDKIHYRYFTLSTLAQHLMQLKERKE